MPPQAASSNPSITTTENKMRFIVLSFSKLRISSDEFYGTDRFCPFGLLPAPVFINYTIYSGRTARSFMAS